MPGSCEPRAEMRNRIDGATDEVSRLRPSRVAGGGVSESRQSKTHGLSEAVVRVDTASEVVFLAGADASDADADVASRQADPLDEKGWAALAATGSLSDTKALARGRLGGA